MFIVIAIEKQWISIAKDLITRKRKSKFKLDENTVINAAEYSKECQSWDIYKEFMFSENKISTDDRKKVDLLHDNFNFKQSMAEHFLDFKTKQFKDSPKVFWFFFLFIFLKV